MSPATWAACPLWKPCSPPGPGDPVVLVLGLTWALLFWILVAGLYRLWMGVLRGRM
jgi:hypothetical protein